MSHAARVTMSMRELDRLKCIQAVVDGDLYAGIAADRLGITTRQLRRIAQRNQLKAVFEALMDSKFAAISFGLLLFVGNALAADQIPDINVESNRTLNQDSW